MSETVSIWKTFNDAFLFLQQNEIIKVHWWWGDIYSSLSSCEILKKVKCSGFLLSVEVFICLQGMTGYMSSHILGLAALSCPASLSSKVILTHTFARGCCFAFPDAFWVICKQQFKYMNYVPNTSVWSIRSKLKKGQTIQYEDAQTFFIRQKTTSVFPYFRFTRYWWVNDHIAIYYYYPGEPLQHKKAFCRASGKWHCTLKSTAHTQELWEGRFRNAILLASFPLEQMAPEEMPLK